MQVTDDLSLSPSGLSGGGGGGEGGTDRQTCCAGCRKAITDRYMLKALDEIWHEDCLKCSCCDCRLGEVGSTLFTRANLLLCRRDYLRLFGATGFCSACSKTIPAFEMVMKAKGNVYHLECFACQQCNHRFCIGDRYYLQDNRILCEADYADRASFNRLSRAADYGSSSLAQIKKHAQSSSSSSVLVAPSSASSTPAASASHLHSRDIGVSLS